MNQPDPNIKGGPATDETEERDDAIIVHAFGWSLLVIGFVIVVGGAVAFLLTRPDPPQPVQQLPRKAARIRDVATVQVPDLPFADITSAAGVKFEHFNGAYGDKLLPETMGSGCAFFDFDNDGDQDLLFVNSCAWAWKTQPDPRPTPVLYKNDGTGRFEDVTAACGLDKTLYGMGVACGDYDRDGWVDLFISTVGRNVLFHNSQGRFEDVTEAAGVGGSEKEWSTSSGFFDYDNDGDLDLFVCNYVRWSREIDLAQDFRLVGVGRAYGPPMAFEGTFPYLYRNDGNGKFSDVSAEAGIQVKNPSTGLPMAKSMGLVPVDLNGDDWLDVVVANDTVQNFVYLNRRDGTFEEVGALVGIAFDSSGNARGAMGIDSARYRDDDTLAIAIGNFSNEMTAFYVSQGKNLQFTDDAIATGLGPPSRLELKFGLFFFDCDLDGRLDLFTSNGHLEEEINKVQASQHYAQPPHLFWNCGPDQPAEFLPVPAAKCGPDFMKPLVGRGAAYADIDGDGDLDLAVMANGGPARLFRNDQAHGHHWLRIKLRGKQVNPDAIGSWVSVRTGGRVLQRQVMPTRSYCSQTELPLTFGLGKSETVEGITIRWPDGSSQEMHTSDVDQLLVIEQETRN